METEGFWLWIERKFLNVVDVILLLSWFDNLVKATLTECVADIGGLFANESLKDGADQERVLVISDTTSVVDDGAKVVQHLIWDFFILFNEKEKLFSANP